MKRIMVTMIMAIAAALMAIPAQADVTYAPNLGIFGTGNDEGDNPIVDGTYLMILDLDGDGWNGVSYLEQSPGINNTLSWLWDADDVIMDRGRIGVDAPGWASPFRKYATSEIPAGYDPGVDDYYLLWFDLAYNAAAAGPGAYIDYGAESLGKVGSDPGDYAPFALGGPATLHTVPEPISAFLMVIGGGMVAVRARRFNHANVSRS